VLVLIGCRGSDGEDEDELTFPEVVEAARTGDIEKIEVTGTSLVVTIEECQSQSLPAQGDSNHTIRAGDLDRTYILHVPPQYDGETRLPLVLNLHGFGSNARNQAAYSRLPQKADEEGFIVVSPDGAGTPQQWNNAQLPSGADDVAFIRALLDHLESTLCIDPSRIYAAGISNGAAFSSRLACNMPDRIAGIALIAATIYPIICDSESPTPVIAFHGTEDRCVPYEGGTTACGRGALPVQPAETYAAQWANHDGCDPTPARTQLTEHVRTLAWSDCDENTAVLLYTVEGGGHTWPGSIDVPRLGPVTGEIDATDLMWEFFEAQAP
jgi:polyhydroxybutyrate depolymerase